MKSIIQEHRAACSRRNVMKKGLMGMAGLSLAGMISSRFEDQIAYATQNVSRASAPSQLQITDLRIAHIARSPMNCPLIRIDTNQGISGYGEVRDGGSPTYALMLKSRLLRQNPCNVELLFKRVKQFGGHARQGGGVSGVEMALWDLAGKAYGVPVYQLLGGKYRDRIRLYADTPEGGGGGFGGRGRGPTTRAAGQAANIQKRIDQGYTWLKMDLGINSIRNVPGALVYPPGADFSGTKHPFTGITLTDRGCALLAERFAVARQEAGSIPICSDHFGSISVKSCIKLARALSPYQPAWLEDMIPWQYTDLLREIKTAMDVPLLTGEDIFLLENFRPLIEQHAVDYVHPDLATAGGILETKKIGDFAEEHGVAMAMHAAGSPISFMANVHCAAATQNVLALEHHGVDISYWEDLVTGIDKPIVQRGYVRVPEKPGLGVEPNPEVVKQHLMQGQEYFGPTDQWSRDMVNDKLWS